MSYFLRITRTPYEEPYHLQLLLETSNGRQSASLEIYVNADSIKEMSNALEAFPRHATDAYLFEVGSEREEDRWAYYLRFQAFLTNALGHSALLFRFNNNRELPYRELAEFCIETEPASINRLGGLLKEFSKLQHKTLYWSPDDSLLNI
jgi:hypothetical protein